MYSANAQSTVRFLVMSARPRRIRERPVRRDAQGTRKFSHRPGWLEHQSPGVEYSTESKVCRFLRPLLPDCSHTRADLGFPTKDEAVVNRVRVLYDKSMEVCPCSPEEGAKLNATHPARAQQCAQNSALSLGAISGYLMHTGRVVLPEAIWRRHRQPTIAMRPQASQTETTVATVKGLELVTTY